MSELNRDSIENATETGDVSLRTKFNKVHMRAIMSDLVKGFFVTYGDDTPFAKFDSSRTGLGFGAGVASALDVYLDREAAGTLAVRNAADDGYGDFLAATGTFDGIVAPAASLAYTLGTSGLLWTTVNALSFRGLSGAVSVGSSSLFAEFADHSTVGDGVRLVSRGLAVLTALPTGHVSPGGDNTQDLGLAATRWRTGYFGTSVLTGAGSVGAPGYAFGDDSTTGIRLRNAGQLSFITAGNARWFINGSGNFLAEAHNSWDFGSATSAARSVYAGTSVIVGTNPASAGAFRMPNAGAVKARNSANDADITAFQVNSGNRMQLGLGASSIEAMVDFRPSIDNSQNFGSAAVTWKNFYVGSDGSFLGNLSIGTQDTIANTRLYIKEVTNLRTRVVFSNENSGGTALAGMELRSNGGVTTIDRNSTGYASRDPNTTYFDLGGGNFVLLDSTVEHMRIEVLGDINIGTSVPGAMKLGTSTSTLGLFGATPVAKPTITGSRGGNAALADLLTKLATLGLLVDSTS